LLIFISFVSFCSHSSSGISVPADQSSPAKIIVLTDDLSGAAELAGIAFAHGLSAEVQRGFDPSADAQLIAIDTDSRHLSPADAAATVRQTTEQVLATSPAWLFKKVDSVLRGNVRAEIEAILDATGQSRAILIPANPSRGRIITGGRYLIDGITLDQTHFAHDPEFPRTASAVAVLLGSDGQRAIRLIPFKARLPKDGIIVPDVASLDDLLRRANLHDAHTLLAGAADFFSLLLNQHSGQIQRGRESFSPDLLPCRTTLDEKDSRPLPASIVRPPALLICGSAAAWSHRLAACAMVGIPGLTIGEDLPDLQNFGALLLGIGDSNRTDQLSALATMATNVIQRSEIKTLLAEGGATAAAIAKETHWRRFEVVATAPAGVGVLRPLAPSAPLFLIKPGSYPWPPEIWQQFCMGDDHRRER
jgi:D-threonate/D-erythronate kinase